MSFIYVDKSQFFISNDQLLSGKVIARSNPTLVSLIQLEIMINAQWVIPLIQAQ